VIHTQHLISRWTGSRRPWESHRQHDDCADIFFLIKK